MRWTDRDCCNIHIIESIEKSNGRITGLDKDDSLSIFIIPNIEIIEIINMLLIESIQLKINILISRLDEIIPISIPFKQFVILLPPRNWSAPSKPPLWISIPDIPMRYIRLEPLVSSIDAPIKNCIITIDKAEIKKLATIFKANT